MPRIITIPLPHDLPEDWKDTQYVSPGGTEVGLSNQHGYNYLMKMVNNAHLALAELDAYLASIAGNKNLLHNWYLKTPIDTKNGYFIPSGSSYYASQDLSSRVGTTPYAITPNYIGSSYATYVMGGNTFYVSKLDVERGYIGGVDASVCIDRWRLKSHSTLLLSSIQPQSSGCKITLSKQTGDFYQNVANALGSKFTAQTYTFSASINSISDGTIYIYITDGVSTKQTRVSASGIHSVSITVSGGASKLVVGIKNTNATNAGVIHVSAVKLEVGNVSTLENDPPADKAEQMAQCIQFDANTDEYRGFTSIPTANVLAEAEITE